MASECTGTPGLHNDGCGCSSYIECPGCRKQLKRTTSGKYRKHLAMGRPEDCDFSGTVIQEEECSSTETAPSQSASSAKLSRDGAPDPARPATPSTESCPPSPEPAESASTASAPSALSGVDQYLEALEKLREEQAVTYQAQVDANLTPFSPPAPVEFEPDQPPLFSQPAEVFCPCQEVHGKIKCQGTCGGQSPAPSFSQPAGRKSEAPSVPMSADAASIAARVKEIFYAYGNRNSSDNRSAQTTMGPSEMGSPCDRRLALSLMRLPAISPGSDGWAAFCGTSIHAGLEQVFMWANGDTGRFAVEQRLEYPSAYVPKGTADLIDRVLLMVVDHKCMGRWSRNKLKSQGPSDTYRIQAHVYAHGARLRGEKIDRVAIIAWPRDEATLEDLYVWTEEYRPDIVQKAFGRVERIGDAVAPLAEASNEEKARKSAEFDVADDCRFCKYYFPKARDITVGCNGKK